MTTHRAGDPQGHPAPTPDVAPVPREGHTAAFVYWGALQGKPGRDPMQHSSCRMCTQNFCFPVQKELLHGVFV